MSVYVGVREQVSPSEWMDFEDLPFSFHSNQSRMVYYEDKIFIVLGYNSSNQFRSFVYSSDDGGLTWTRLQDVNSSITSATVNTKLIVYGNKLHLFINRLHYIYDEDNDEWTSTTDNGTWTSRGSLADVRTFIVFNNYIYAFGSYNTSYKTNVYKYDGETWTDAPSFPIAITTTYGSFEHNGKLYINPTAQYSSDNKKMYSFDGVAYTLEPEKPSTYGFIFSFNNKVYWLNSTKNIYYLDGSLWVKSDILSDNDLASTSSFDVFSDGSRLFIYSGVKQDDIDVLIYDGENVTYENNPGDYLSAKFLLDNKIYEYGSGSGYGSTSAKAYSLGTSLVEPKRVIRGWINAREGVTTFLYKPHSLSFTETEDSSFDPTKEYYEKSETVYTITTDATMDPSKTYYEMDYVGRLTYFKTDDQSFDPTKEYYERYGTDYVLTEDVSMDPEKIYYELYRIAYLVYLKVDDEYQLADLSSVDVTNSYYIKYPHKESVLGVKKIIRIFAGNSDNKPIVIGDGSYWAMSNLDPFKNTNIIAKEEFGDKLHILTSSKHYTYDGLEGLVEIGNGLNILSNNLSDSLYFDNKWYVSTGKLYQYTWHTYSGTMVNGYEYYNYLDLYYYDFGLEEWVLKRIFMWSLRKSNGQRSYTDYAYKGNYLFEFNNKLYIYIMKEKITVSYDSSTSSTKRYYTEIDEIYEVDLKSDVKNLSATIYDSRTGRSRQVTHTLNGYVFKNNPVYTNEISLPTVPSGSAANNTSYKGYRKSRDILSKLFKKNDKMYMIYYYSMEYVGYTYVPIPRYDSKGNIIGYQSPGLRTTKHSTEAKSSCKVLSWDGSKFVASTVDFTSLESSGIELVYDSKTVYPIAGNEEIGYSLFDHNSNNWYRLTFDEDDGISLIKQEASDAKTPFKIPAESYGVTQKGKTPVMFNERIFIFPDSEGSFVRRENPDRYF